MDAHLHDTSSETRYGEPVRERPYWIGVRRLDSRWHVTAEDRDEGLIHTHRHGFRDRRDAYRLLDRVRDWCEGAGELGLRWWETEGCQSSGPDVRVTNSSSLRFDQEWTTFRS